MLVELNDEELEEAESFNYQGVTTMVNVGMHRNEMRSYKEDWGNIWVNDECKLLDGMKMIIN